MAPTGSYLGTWTNTGDLTTYTYTQATHGQSPAAGIILIATNGQNSRTVSSVTVNGVSATQQVGITTGSRTNYFFAIQHSGGDLGDIVVTLNAGGNRNSISLFGITERTNITADDTDGGDTTDPLSGTVNTTTNCFVAAAVASSNGGTFTWTNLTERYDAAIEGSSQWSVASDTITSAGTVSPSANASGVLANGSISMVSYFLSNSVTTMTASPGSYAYTGVAAGLLQARKLIADVGTFVYSGITAGTLAALKMAADAGSYTLSGIDAALRFGQILIAEAGAYTYTGVAATLQAIVSMPAAAGAYVYTGFDAGLKAAKILTAEVGAYIYSGIDVIFLKGQLLIAEAGAYVLTGVATLKHIVMRNLTGSYVYTGVAANLQGAMKVFADAGSYALTGVAVTFIKGQIMVAEAGAYVLTGIATLKHIVLQHLAGAYTYTGISATLKHIVLQQKLLIAEAGSYVMTGFNAVLVYRLPLAAPAAWVKRKVQATLASTRAAAASLFKRRQVQSKLSRRRQSDPALGD